MTSIQIKSADSTFYIFFFAGGPDILGPTAAFVGPFRPPNRLLAMFCLTFSSGAIIFFFSFSLVGEAGETKTGDLTYLAS